MLRDEIALYTELSGHDGEHMAIGIIGAYLDGYDKGKEERPQGEWIPVGKRLPDYLEDTLVTIQVNNREPRVRSGFYANGCFHNDNGDTWNWNDPEIKAWQPLPKPYEEADNEQNNNNS